MTENEFEVEVGYDDALAFASISGDWNPLHTDRTYAAKTNFRKIVLHGAFSAGLISRMAGMWIPGQDCLLYRMSLKFVAPIFPPARLRVHGSLSREYRAGGLVSVTISDSVSGARYVEGSYEFGRHHHLISVNKTNSPNFERADAPILVTGASGGIGSALLKCLGARALGLSRSGVAGALMLSELADLSSLLEGRKISGIVHCGGPPPDNLALLSLEKRKELASGIDFQIAQPLGDCLKLAQALSQHGLPGSPLILVGSTFSRPGRHNWRMPLYSLSKALIPTLVEILALELAAYKLRCLGVVFDVLDGPGMNNYMQEKIKLMHSDRSPSGILASTDEAAHQISWVLDNPSHLVSGAVITLSGGSIP